jgi:hypothetical protein
VAPFFKVAWGKLVLGFWLFAKALPLKRDEFRSSRWARLILPFQGWPRIASRGLPDLRIIKTFDPGFERQAHSPSRPKNRVTIWANPASSILTLMTNNNWSITINREDDDG